MKSHVTPLFIALVFWVGALFFARRRPLEHVSFEALRQDCLEGKEEAHREFIARFDALFWQVVRAHLPDRPREDHEEVVANTHLAFLGSHASLLSRYEPMEGVKPEAYLRRQAVYQCMSHRRALLRDKRRNEVLMAPTPEGSSPLENIPSLAPSAEVSLADHASLADLLTTFEHKLSPIMLLTFELVFVRELPPESAAQSLGCTVGTLYTRINRLREIIQQILKERDASAPLSRDRV